jgi:hypothetical protein
MSREREKTIIATAGFFDFLAALAMVVSPRRAAETLSRPSNPSRNPQPLSHSLSYHGPP